MDTAFATQSRLHIRRLRAEYLVASAHPHPERLKARLDTTLAHSVADMLSALLSPGLPDTDPSIWLIRRLETEVDVDAAWDQEQMSRVWATHLARALTCELHEDSDGSNVVRFADHAAYLARFLVDVAEGCAWGKWYYEAFEGLRLLPTSAVLRTVLCEYPRTGSAALLQLPTGTVTRVLRALTVQDARRVLNRMAEETPAGDALCCFQAVWSVWETVVREASQASNEWHQALHLYLAASRVTADVGGPSLRTAALALLCLARCLANMSASHRHTLLAALGQGDLATLYKVTGAADAEALVPLCHCPPAWVYEVGQILQARNAGQAGETSTTRTPGPRSTPFGGLFLLLPQLDDLPLAEATRGWPEVEEATAVALVRFLLLMKCCGQPRARSVFSDPVVRDLMGIPPALSLTSVHHWQAGISATHRRTFLETLAAWHSERGTIHGAPQILARVAAPGSPVAVLMDGARGVWIWASGYHPRHPERCLPALQHWLTMGTQAETPLLSDAAFLDTLSPGLPGRMIVSLHDDAVRTMAEADPQLAAVLARLDRLPEDLLYLALPRGFGYSRLFDLALSVTAQGVMHAFAWRLPGFAGSNLPYLWRNFLNCAGSVEDEPARQVVRLGRCPLQLILNITGMTRSTYRLSWLQDRPFALFPEG